MANGLFMLHAIQVYPIRVTRDVNKRSVFVGVCITHPENSSKNNVIKCLIKFPKS